MNEPIIEKPELKEGDKDTLTIEGAAPVPEAPKKPTRAEKKAEGWSDKELDSAVKHGLILEKAEETPPAPKPGEPKPAAPKAGEEPAPAEGSIPPVPKPGLPEMILSPEKEAEFVKAFGPGTPQNGLYFRMKNERKNRQRVEAENAQLKARLDTLESAIKNGVTAKPAIDPDEDPDNQPLTPARLRELQKQEREEQEKLRGEQEQRRLRLNDAHVEQEEYAKTIYKDFDDAMVLAQDLVTNLDTLVTDPLVKEEIIENIIKMQKAAQIADKLSVDQMNASHIAYRLGRLHPKYGQKPGNTEQPTKGDPKGDGSLSPEKLKRIEKNADKKGSSAALPDGGGKRVISVEDVDLTILNDMDVTERLAFKKKYPERYRKLLNG